MSRRRTGATLALAISLVAMVTVAAAQQTPIFRARREMVRIDVLVTERNHPVTGLGQADFQILDNGVPQELELIRADEQPINAIMALDLSGSVNGERLDQLRGASRALLGALVKDDRAALVGFSHRVELGAPLTTDLPSVVASLGRTHAGGQTALYDATYAGLVLGEADAGRSLLIVFSDGLDTSSFLSKDAVLDIAKRSAAVVYGVAVDPTTAPAAPAMNSGQRIRGVGTLQSALRLSAEAAYGAAVGDWKPAFLNDVSALTGGAVFEVESTRNLDTLFVNVLAEFRHRYLLAYSPQGVTKDGWHKIDVTVKTRKGLTVKARPGYQAGS